MSAVTGLILVGSLIGIARDYIGRGTYQAPLGIIDQFGLATEQTCDTICDYSAGIPDGQKGDHSPAYKL